MDNKIKTSKDQSKIQIGCQGWNYADWVTKAGSESVFYPRGTRAGEMLEIYAKVFETIEVDSTFYAIPPVSSLESWFNKTPEDFTFALKLPQEITHELELRESSFHILEEFCERIKILQDKLAVVLVQLAPGFEASKENAINLRKFLERLPKEIRFAVEFRNREWIVDWTFEELEKNNTALCLVEGNWIPRELMLEAIAKPTADFSYIRFMGERDLKSFERVVRPQDTNLEIWQKELAKLRVTRSFIYFSNFYEGYAPESSNKLKHLFKQQTKDASSLEIQKSLF
jgi:uncharacterized protein YecE (DUF72 family)